MRTFAGRRTGKWHEDGDDATRRTHTDLHCRAEYLVSHGYGSKDSSEQLRAGTSRRLLMGAVLNMRADLSHAALVVVPRRRHHTELDEIHYL